MVHSTHRRSSEGPLWLTYWGYKYIWCPVRILHITNRQMIHSMHQRSSEGPLWLMYWGYTYIGCTDRILQIKNSQMVHLMHWRSLEGPLWLTYWGYTYIWCAVGVLHITAFHWCEISNKTLGGPLIILQTVGWTIQRTGDHQRGRFDWYTKVTDMFDILLESCISYSFPLI